MPYEPCLKSEVIWLILSHIEDCSLRENLVCQTNGWCIHWSHICSCCHYKLWNSGFCLCKCYIPTMLHRCASHRFLSDCAQGLDVRTFDFLILSRERALHCLKAEKVVWFFPQCCLFVIKWMCTAIKELTGVTLCTWRYISQFQSLRLNFRCRMTFLFIFFLFHAF